MNLIHIAVIVAMQPEDGACLASRYWAIHPAKGVAFAVEKAASGREELRPLCVTNALATEKLLRDLGPGYEAKPLAAVFLQHAEAVIEARRPKPVVVAAPAPSPKPVRRLTAAEPSPKQVREQRTSERRWERSKALAA